MASPHVGNGVEATSRAMTWLVSNDTYFQKLGSEPLTHCFHNGVLATGWNSNTQPENDFHRTHADVEISSEGIDPKGRNRSHSDTLGNGKGFGHDKTAICPQKTNQLAVDVLCIQPGRIDGALAAMGLWGEKLGLEMSTLDAGENTLNEGGSWVSAMNNAETYLPTSVHCE